MLRREGSDGPEIRDGFCRELAALLLSFEGLLRHVLEHGSFEVEAHYDQGLYGNHYNCEPPSYD